jgi:cytosine/adenosine deaminase-related metal-dependent hydrolase
MEYRKFKADYLFNGSNLLEEDLVLITDSTCKIIEIVHYKNAGEGVESFRGILSPGFINAHCHMELSHLKNLIPEKKGLADFVYSVVTGRNFEEEKILAAIANAETEMQECGIVAVGDICNNSLSLAKKEQGKIAYYNFIETSGWNPSIAEARFQKSKSYYDEFISKGQIASIVPHAPYSVSQDLWEKISPFFASKVVTIHNQETKDEDEFFLNGSGSLVDLYKRMNIDNSFYKPIKLRSLQSYFKNFAEASSVILVHNTYMKEQDLEYLNKTTSRNQILSFCLCANANLYIENALPPIDILLENNSNIVIGTDSLASNHQLNILEELKTIAKNFPGILTEMLLKWATLNGAKALQMERNLGSFIPGKQPGIVLIENISGDKLTPDSNSRRIL